LPKTVVTAIDPCCTLVSDVKMVRKISIVRNMIKGSAIMGIFICFDEFTFYLKTGVIYFTNWVKPNF
jgi:hypothetical protein